MAFSLSFEFFPPKTSQGADKLKQVRQELMQYKPEFCSVTYGAGGSTQEGSFATLAEMIQEGHCVAAHFSCIGTTKQDVREKLSRLKEMGVKRLVALRGDWPSGYGIGGEFQYASELVAYIREIFGSFFHIDVAAYPETHPQAKTAQADIQAFMQKVKAGADSAITQYFYNVDAYVRWVKEVREQGCQIPIIPGIMPITNSAQLIRFSDMCGAEIPRWIRLRLQEKGDDVQAIKAFGIEVTTRLCEQLIDAGAPGFHIYTMNQSQATAALLSRLGR